jgi:hypothetical protein
MKRGYSSILLVSKAKNNRKKEVYLETNPDKNSFILSNVTRRYYEEKEFVVSN